VIHGIRLPRVRGFDMANITDPATINFSNTKIRNLAGVLAGVYIAAKQRLALDGGSTSDGSTTINALLTANPTEFLDDGSLTGGSFGNGQPDGRSPIQGQDVLNVLAVCEAVVAMVEANSNQVLDQLSKVVVNTPQF
jgi:hypothetical protein